LGFSQSLYQFYQKPDNTTRPISETQGTVDINGSTYNTIILPEVVQFAREYFNCQTLSYVPLEQEGGVGSADSHWDKAFLPNEYMNPTIESPGIISEFTIKLLTSSGWYLAEDHSAQQYSWGRDDGCAHFNICPSGREYCTAAQVNKNMCTPDNMSKAYCASLSAFMEGCFMIRQIETTNCLKEVETQGSGGVTEETYGAHSRCFEWREKSGDKNIIPQCHVAKVS
jgi:leishmanolysin